MQTYSEEDQVSIYDLDMEYGKMFREPFPAENPRARTFGSSSKNSSELVAIPFMSLDLTPGAGNLLGEFYWEILSPWRGNASMLNTGPAPPNGAAGSTLWSILEERPHPKYYLSKKACLGIIRRASERGKELPPKLKRALEIQAGLIAPDGHPTGLDAYHINQRDEGIDLNGVSGALMATSNMQMQTFVTQPDAAQEADVLCLNDQGGQYMSSSENVVGTLRAQMHSHQPLVLATQQGGAEIGVGICPTITAAAGMSSNNQPVLYENHGIDSRYKGPFSVSPTLSARAGTGGNNLPLVEQETDVFCIAGNTIDRQPHNGGNGIGYQDDLAYTLTATDRHAVFSRQRTDCLRENDVVSTESVRQHKDATDLVMQPYQRVVGSLQRSDHKGISNQYVRDDKCVVESTNLIRRLTPLECERLQGFPDYWTHISAASDSAAYKALGNSVAIPCVDHVMRGIVLVMRIEEHRRRVWIIIRIL